MCEFLPLCCNISSLLQLKKGLALLHLQKGIKYTYPVPAPTAKGTLITLPNFPYIIADFDTTCWGEINT